MNPFDDVAIALALPPTHYVIEHVKPRARLDLLPGTKDNPLWMEQGFLAFVERSNEKKSESETTEIIDARTAAKEAAGFYSRCSIIGWALQSEDGSWTTHPYTPEKCLAFLSRIIDLEGGLGVFRQVEAEIINLTSTKSLAVDAEAASGNSSSG